MIKTIKTKNIYEAAFYILWGGVFANVRKTVLNKKKADKNGYLDQWTVTIDNVPRWAIDTWKTDQAYGNITDYVNVRIKLKKRIKHDLGR